MHESVIDKNSECSKHVQEYLNHEFQLSLPSIVPRNTFRLKILGSVFY